MNTSSIVLLAALTVGSYLLGNISPATIMGHLYGVDIRKEGSGNPGTTNVLRTLGAKAAIVTLLIDVAKGFIPAFFCTMITGEIYAGYICGSAAFIGHIWPCFYKFKGGKGIATGFGVLLGIDWRVGLLCALCAIFVALITKRMSCGSIAAGIAVAVLITAFDGMPYGFWGIGVGVIIIWRHRGNIQRILNGTEPTIGFLDRKSKSDSEQN